ncbi:MAG: hypothetical protein JST30_15610 [Armatimonadetes bacterium]|nr:hypothetical protein [Armatimonadota bacterium]
MATTFRLVPLDLGSGWTMTGTVETDGTVGPLSASNIVSWSIDVTSATGYSWDATNTSDFSQSVLSDGQKLYVPTSPDGFSDGGVLGFYGSVYDQVRVADFSGAYAAGGVALYIKGSAFDFLDLGQPNGFLYEAADVDPFDNGLFVLRPVTFLDGTTLKGTVRTDGSLGVTTFVDWHVRVEQTSTFTFSPSNSTVKIATGLSTDGRRLAVTPTDEYGNGNAFEIGFGTFDPTLAVLADFTWLPEGQAGYISPFGMFTVSPLPLNTDGDYIVAHVTGTFETVPSAERILLGKGTLGNVASWSSPDGDARRVCKFFVPSMTAPAVRIDLDFPTDRPVPVAVSLDLTVRAVQAGSYVLRSSLFDQTQGSFVTIIPDTHVTTSYSTLTGAAGGNLADYFAIDGTASVRLEVRQTGPGAAMLPCFEFDAARLVITE